MFELKRIIKESNLSEASVARALSGRSCERVYRQLRLAIYRVTRQLIPVSELAKGEYSVKKVVRELCIYLSRNDKRTIPSVSSGEYFEPAYPAAEVSIIL